MKTAKTTDVATGVERALVRGDLGQMSADERLAYYRAVCDSLQLNPRTRPFEYLTLQGRLTLYARRDCADQLRRINGVSLEIVSRHLEDGVYTVRVRATLPDGRTDEDEGAVFVGGLKGETLANGYLKAVTKGKRRVTLSICGLGFLDETEVADVPRADVPTREMALPAPSEGSRGEGRTDAPRPVAPAGRQANGAGKVAVPADGAELYDWLVAREALLVAAGRCAEGELVRAVADA